MEKLEEITKLSRFVTVAYKNNMYTIEANFWPANVTEYTINVRASGKTLDNAIKNLFKRVRNIKEN